jgi:beta-galactosidase
MATSRRTWFDERGLSIAAADGKIERLDLYVGSMHYWRVPASDWRKCLIGLRSLGLTAVASPVPWRVHEPGDGRFDWSGARDLRRFVELAGELDLAVLLCVGPSANAQLPGFGFPDDVLHDPEIAARTSHGSMAWLPALVRALPLPSYASSKLHARVALWYHAIAQQVGSLSAPCGPLVALGIDHQGHRLLRRGAYDLDYHPEAIARWAALHPQWPEPPRRWQQDDSARCLAWVRFKDQAIASALGQLATAIDDTALAGLARFHSAPLQQRGALAIASAIAGLVALESHDPVDTTRLRRAGLRAMGSATPMPFVLESGVGSSPWLPVAVEPTSDSQRALALLAAGARGLGFSMAVEREHWAGGLLDANGKVADDAGWVAKLLAAMRAVDWPSLRRRPLVAVVTSDGEAQFAEATCLVDPWPSGASEVLHLGAAGHAELGGAGGEVSGRWQQAVEYALDRAGLPYVVLDQSATVDQLAEHRAVIAPLGDRVDRTLWHTLRALTEQPQVMVVIGPALPSRDPYGQPLDEPALRGAGKMRAGSLDDLDGLSADLARLVRNPSSWHNTQREIVMSLVYDGEQRVRVAFLCNGSATNLTTSLTVNRSADLVAPSTIRDVLSDELLTLGDPERPISVPARSIRMFVVEPATG